MHPVDHSAHLPPLPPEEGGGEGPWSIDHMDLEFEVESVAGASCDVWSDMMKMLPAAGFFLDFGLPFIAGICFWFFPYLKKKTDP